MREHLLSKDDHECWRPCGEFLVSSHGRVANQFGVIMSPERHYKGYLRVKSLGRKNKTVHSLVSTAFLGPKPSDHVVDHLDEDKSHNTPINLEYVTVAENNRRYRQRKAARERIQNVDCAA